MDNTDTKAFKSGIWYTVCNFLTRSLGLITTPIFARLFTKAEFGDYSNFITWMNLLPMLVSCCLFMSVNRARFEFGDELDKYNSTILLSGTAITGTFYLIVLIDLPFFENFFSMDAFYIHLMFIYLLTQPALEIFYAKQRAFYKYKSTVFVSLLSSLSTTIISIVLVLMLEDNFFARSIGYVVPLVIINGVLYLYLFFKGKSFKFKYFKYAFFFSWPFVPHLLSNNLLSASDRIMITSMCGSQYTAIYTLACSCSSIAAILWVSVSNAMTPWMFDKLETKEYDKIYNVTIPYILVFGIPIELCLLIAPEILIVLGGRTYMDAKYAIVPLMISIVFQFVETMYFNVEQYEKKTWYVASGAVIAAVINLILNVIFIRNFGYNSAAYATLIGYIVLFVIHYIFCRHLGYAKIFNQKFIFTFLAGSILIIIPMLFLYDHTLIRYSVLAAQLIVISIFAIKYREKIMSFVKTKFKKTV